jgi:hypothetical protein
MTSRRCTVLEQGACEQLRLNGYEVRILPTGNDKRLPPAHLVASRSGETRYIRIYKMSHRHAAIDTVEHYFTRDIVRYRSQMARYPQNATSRYEIWLYTLTHGYHCFWILPEQIQEIPRAPGRIAVRVAVGEPL